MAKYIFKEIRLIPTHFTLDVFVTRNESFAQTFVGDRYSDLEGMFQFDFDTQILNTVSIVPLVFDKKLVETRILLCLESLADKSTLAHELIHVLWALSEIVGIEMNKDSQEWQAYMMGYLFDEILNIPKTLKSELKKSA